MDEDKLYDLIARMTIKEQLTSSEESVSWNAYREAERISDETVYPILKKIIEENHKNKAVREAAYVIIGYSLRNIFNKEACIFLIQRLDEETDKYVVACILDKLARIHIPEDIDMSLVIKCSQNDKWQIRHSALNALGSSSTHANREALLFFINQEDEKKYEYEIIYANASLGSIGSKEDIPFLEKHVKSRKRDIRDSARFAIDRIKEREV
jgi:HEAT repeat protein